jgi:hypothetical protein
MCCSFGQCTNGAICEGQKINGDSCENERECASSHCIDDECKRDLKQNNAWGIVILISLVVFVLSHLLNLFLSKMAQGDDSLEYQRMGRNERKNRYTSDSSDAYESERVRIRNMRKKDQQYLKQRRKHQKESSSESDTPKSRFLLRNYQRPMDRASRVLLDKNSSNRLISKATLRGGKQKEK